jgi:hypothetical protein
MKLCGAGLFFMLYQNYKLYSDWLVCCMADVSVPWGGEVMYVCFFFMDGSILFAVNVYVRFSEIISFCIFSYYFVFCIICA